MNEEFEDADEQRTAFAKWWTEGYAEAFEFFNRRLARSLGREWFWDENPAERKHFYAVHPPFEADGFARDHKAMGGPDWALIARKWPGEYERYREDYGKLVKDEARKLAGNGVLA